MSAIPAFLLKKLYVKGSLKASADGCSLTIKNTIASGTIARVTFLKIDGQSIPLEQVTISRAGNGRPASSIAPAKPLAFNLNDEATVTVTGTALQPGPHTLALSLRTVEVGELSIQIEDTL